VLHLAEEAVIHCERNWGVTPKRRDSALGDRSGDLWWSNAPADISPISMAPYELSEPILTKPIEIVKYAHHSHGPFQ
jgi:hypothetical protein